MFRDVLTEEGKIAEKPPQATGTLPVVSVLMLAYAHEKYLVQAVESVLRQQSDFPLELVVGVDLSPDRTRDIADRYERTTPDVVRVLHSDSRLGMHGNFRRTLAACRGRFVAILEGDDYWTDDHKIARQVRMMEDDPNCTVSFHAATRVWDGEPGRLEVVRPRPTRETYTAGDLIRDNLIVTPSVMFRARLWPALPAWFDSLEMIDWPLHILNASFGHVRYLDLPMAAYRIHDGGIWSGRSYLSCVNQAMLMYDALDRHFGSRFRRIVAEGRDLHMARLSHYLVATARAGQGFREQVATLTALLRTLPSDLRATLLWRLATGLRLLRTALLDARTGDDAPHDGRRGTREDG